MKVFIAAMLVFFLLFLAFQIYSFSRKAGAIDAERAAFEAQLRQADQGHANLESEKRYSEQEANLEKELRARFNYKAPGEKMVIIVPAASSSASSSTSQ